MADLIERLQASTSGSRELDAEICKQFRPDLFQWHWYDAKALQAKGASEEQVMRALLVRRSLPVVTTSLDAAIALVREVLPAMKPSFEPLWSAEGWIVRLRNSPVEYANGNGVNFKEAHTSAAIALMICLLRAQEATTDSEGDT